MGHLPASPACWASMSYSLCLAVAAVHAVGHLSLCPAVVDVSAPELVPLEPLGHCWEQPLGS